MDVSLDPTLGCGQAHRWRRAGDGSWQGVIGNDVVTVSPSENGFYCDCKGGTAAVREYFRECDNLEEIVREISSKDPDVAMLSSRCPGLRILKQPEWECLATYVLATNVNVKRIAKMVESVCDLFGTDLGARRAFPTPKQILDRKELLPQCRLGFREPRFLKLAEDAENGNIDVEGMKDLPYEQLHKELCSIYGVGPKVADCVAIFGYGHLSAFPIDVRIAREMEVRYGVTGSYSKVSAYGRKKFGRYAGYAQEFLYHAEFID